jgi:hypothetical protein
MDGKNELITAGKAYLLLFFTIFCAFRCEEEKQPEFVFMSFVIPISIRPVTEEVALSDTLWIQGSFADTLLEYYSGEYYKLAGFDFKSKLCLRELTTDLKYISDQPGAFDKFNISNLIGSVAQVSSICGAFNLIYSQGKYHYRIGLKPTTPGVYCINFLWPIDLHGMPEEQIDLRSVIELDNSADGRQRIPVYEAFYFEVNNGDTNFDLFKQNCRSAAVENPVPINIYYEQKGSFTFRVVE